MTINFRVEYDPSPIRHIAVQCPFCNKWFRGRDIANKRLDYDYEVGLAEYHCPICDKYFSNGVCDSYGRYIERCSTSIEECGSAEEVYKGCLTKKEVWE